MDIIVRDGLIVSMDKQRRILKGYSIGIDDSRIVKIEKNLTAPAKEVIDGTGKIVLPGLINTHTHMSMTLFRGVSDDLPLEDWLRKGIGPIQEYLNEKHVYAGSLLGCLEMISSGTTCFNDMSSFMDGVVKAVKESGMRGVLSHAVMSKEEEKTKSILKNRKNGFKEYNDDKLRIYFGPHSVYTCSDDILTGLTELANRYHTGIHIHVSETQQEYKDAINQYGKTPVEHLDEIGLLSKNVVAAHTVWLSDKDIDILRKKGVKVSHNPTSNLKLASGIARIRDLINRGICVSLGTDGVGCNNNLDMFEEMKLCSLIHKVNLKDASVLPSEKVLEMATIEGARALDLDNEIGSIEMGKRADIILVNTKKPHMVPLTNPVSHIVYAANGGDVSSVIIDGKVVMDNRCVRSIDPEYVMDLANKLAMDLYQRAGWEDHYL